jgi:hypothetical protein
MFVGQAGFRKQLALSEILDYKNEQGKQQKGEKYDEGMRQSDVTGQISAK